MTASSRIESWARSLGVRRPGAKADRLRPGAAARRAALRRKVERQPPVGRWRRGDRAISTRALVAFARQLAAMLDAGVPLAEALAVLAGEGGEPGVARLAALLRGDVRGGSSFSAALARRGRVFGDLGVGLVAAGEASGTLSNSLCRWAQHAEASLVLRRKVASALAYPLVVVAIAMGTTAALLLLVVPVFAELFASFGQPLPLATQLVFGFSAVMREKVAWFALVSIAAGVLGWWLWNLAALRRRRDGLLLRVPGLGNLLRRAAIARSARTLGTLLAAGVSVLEALELSARTSPNRVVEDALLQARAGVQQGRGLADLLLESGVFPAATCQMVAVGERSGALGSMLGTVASSYEGEVDAVVNTLTSVAEPLVIVVLGVVVGGLLLAIYLPIFQLGAVL